MPRSVRLSLRHAAALASVLLAWAPPGHALDLRLSTQLLDRLPPDSEGQAPLFVLGDRVFGTLNQSVTLQGHAELRTHHTVIRADDMTHDLASNTVQATGDVRIVRRGDVFEGPKVQLQLDDYLGAFEQPRFKLLANGGHGQADQLEFKGPNRVVAHRTSFTTCQRPDDAPDWRPDWYFTSRELDLDQGDDRGTALMSVLRFKDVPIFALPYVQFPLSDKRRTGLLPGSLGIDSTSGVSVSAPYYLNLDPQYDATVTPTVMSKRGVDIATELRYLQPSYAGEAWVHTTPNDRLRGQDRWGGYLKHNAVLGEVAQAPVSLGLNINRVSDDNYWKDYGRSPVPLNQRILPSTVVANWSPSRWSFGVNVTQWQTQQDLANPSSVLAAPFNIAPALTATHAPIAIGDTRWQVNASAQLTRFESDRFATGTTLSAYNRNAVRSVLNTELSNEWKGTFWFVRPSLKVRARHFQFDQSVANTANAASFALPTASVDAGLFVERPAPEWGEHAIQTLEPRAFYTHTPYRAQPNVPRFDTAPYDFNLDAIYRDQPFTGNDVIADQHTLTAGLTSRWLFDGMERLRLGVAQRLRFSDQHIRFDPNAAQLTESVSDVLISGMWRLNSQWRVDGLSQYNPDTQRLMRNVVGFQYTPSPMRVFNTAYRSQVNETVANTEFVDVSWQWPVSLPWDAGNRWYSVGRINYSVPEKRAVDTVAGFEYDAGCWVGRVVIERTQNTAATTTQRLLFQLELSGFSRLGANPVKALQTHIPMYQPLRPVITPANRFERYE